MSTSTWFAAVALLTGVVSGAAAAGHTLGAVPASYCVEDLGGGWTEDGDELYVDLFGLNNWGQVAGGRNSYPSLNMAFVWDRVRGMRDLGVLPGYARSSAESINDAGQIVGMSTDAANETSAPFIWDGRNGMRRLDVQTGVRPSVTAINRLGQIAGYAFDSAGAPYSFRRNRNGSIIEIGSFNSTGETYSYALALNDFGTVVGISSHAERLTLAFIWTAAEGLQSLNEPAPLSAFPRAINNRREVVGGTEGARNRAFLWTPAAGYEDLGTFANGDDSLAADAYDINEWSTVVGVSQNAERTSHAFIWRRRSGMQDLNEMIDRTDELHGYLDLRVARHINEWGWIAVQGYDVREVPGGWHGYVLVPRWQHGDRGCD
jgi:probable HAF family extracellular repeat protein